MAKRRPRNTIRSMKLALRLLMLVAAAVIVFYAGLLVGRARPSDQAFRDIRPPPVTATAPGRIVVMHDMTTITVESHTDTFVRATWIAALVAGGFLLVRAAIGGVRLVRLRRWS
jgi:hypothetical protein